MKTKQDIDEKKKKKKVNDERRKSSKLKYPATQSIEDSNQYVKVKPGMGREARGEARGMTSSGTLIHFFPLTGPDLGSNHTGTALDAN